MSAARPTIHDMVKSAMAGALSRAQIAAEAERQLGGEKTASTNDQPTAASTGVDYEYALKLASACDYIAEVFHKEAAEQAPGEGPGALHVMESPGGSPIPTDPGRAIPANQPPINPGLQKARPSDAANQMANDANRAPGAGAGTQKVSSALYRRNLSRLTKQAGPLPPSGQQLPQQVPPIPPAQTGNVIAPVTTQSAPVVERTVGQVADAAPAVAPTTAPVAAQLEQAAEAGVDPGLLSKYWETLMDRQGSTALRRTAQIGTGLAGAGALAGLGYGAYRLAGGGQPAAPQEGMTVQASARIPLHAIRKMAAQKKLAEDAINPARISGQAAVPPDVSESGQRTVPLPAGADMVGSNEAAINLTRRQAKAPQKSDMNAYIREPMQSSAHDHTLNAAFAHTDEAGAKISSAKLKVAAMREILSRKAGG